MNHAEVTGRSGDGGIDGKGIARMAGVLSFHVVFQCKRYQGAVSASQVRDFRGAGQPGSKRRRVGSPRLRGEYALPRRAVNGRRPVPDRWASRDSAAPKELESARRPDSRRVDGRRGRQASSI